MMRRALARLAIALVAAGTMTLAWWGWQVSDASLILLGSRLC